MAEEIIIDQCSPTLAGLKTGNIFTVKITTKAELCRDLRALNKKLCPKGLRAIPLRIKDGRALIYVYRPNRLAEDFTDSDAADILTKLGYDVSNTDESVVALIRKFNENGGFPHEVGLFIGYPPRDVKAFMEGCKCCKCVGCWKVYGDEEKAKRTFRAYEKCTDVYRRQWEDGKPIEKLIVPSR